MPSEHITNNDLKESHQIQILSRVLNHVMDLKQENLGGATRLKFTVAPALPEPTQTKEDYLPGYTPTHTIHHIHPRI